MPNEKLSVQDFAAKVKAKYPSYESYEDSVLVDAFLKKFPVYQDAVDYSPKKKEVTAGESSVTDLPSPSDLDLQEYYSEASNWATQAYNDFKKSKGEDPSESYLDNIDKSFYEFTAKAPIISQIVGGSNRFVGGVLDMFNGLIKESSKFPSPLTGVPNPIVQKSFEEGNYFTDLADTYNENAEYFKKSRAMNSGIFSPNITQEDMDKGFWNNLTEGEVSKASWLLMDGVLENVPSIMVGMTGSQVGSLAVLGRPVTSGTLLMGASSAGNKYRQIEDDPRYSPAEKLAFAFAQGAVETISESLFRGDLNAARSIVSNSSRSNALKDQFINEARMTDVYKKMAAMGNEEGFEEVLVETWDIVTTGIKEGKTIEEINAEIPRIIDAYALGFGSGGGIQIIANGRAARGSLKNGEARKKAAETIKQVEEAVKGMEDPQKKNTAVQLIQEEKRKLNKLIEEDREYYSQFKEEDRNRVVLIDNQLEVLEQQLDLISDSELRAEREQQALDLIKERNEIHGKYPQKVTANQAVPVAPQAAVEEAVEESAPVTVSLTPESNQAKVKDVIGKRVELNKQSGVLTDEGGGKIALYTDDDQIIDLGNIEEIGEQPLEDAGISLTDDLVSVDGDNIVVRGKNYKNNYSDPLSAINRDEEGNILSVTLDSEKGSKRTFKGNVADELAYNIILSQYEDQELESELNKLFDTDEETRKLFEEIESIKEDAAKTAAQSTEQAPAKEQVAEDIVSQEPTPEPVEETTPEAEVKTKTKEEIDEELQGLNYAKLYFNGVLVDRFKDSLENLKNYYILSLEKAKRIVNEKSPGYVGYEEDGYPLSHAGFYRKEFKRLGIDPTKHASKESLFHYNKALEILDALPKEIQERPEEINKYFKKQKKDAAKKAPVKKAPAKKAEAPKEETEKPTEKSIDYKSVMIEPAEESKKDSESTAKYYSSPIGQDVLKLLTEAKNKAGMNFDFKYDTFIDTRIANAYAFGLRILFPYTDADGGNNAQGFAEVSVADASKNIREFAKEYKLDRSLVEENVKQYRNYLIKQIKKALPKNADIKLVSNYHETLREAGLPTDILIEMYGGKSNFEKALDIVFDEKGKLRSKKKIETQVELSKAETRKSEREEKYLKYLEEFNAEVLTEEEAKELDPNSYIDLRNVTINKFDNGPFEVITFNAPNKEDSFSVDTETRDGALYEAAMYFSSLGKVPIIEINKKSTIQTAEPVLKTEEDVAVNAKTDVLTQEDPQGDPGLFNDLLFNEVAKGYTFGKVNEVFNKYLGDLVPKIEKIVKGIKFTNGFIPDSPESKKSTKAQSLKTDSKGFVPFVNALLSFGFEVHVLDNKGAHGIFNTATSNVDPIFAREGFVYNKGKSQVPMTGQEKQEAMSQVSRLLNFYQKGGKISEIIGALNFDPNKEVVIRGTGVREFAQLVYDLRNNPENGLRKDYYEGSYREFSNDLRFKDRILAVVDAKFVSKEDMMDMISKVYDMPKPVVASEIFYDDSLLNKVKEDSKEEKVIIQKVEEEKKENDLSDIYTNTEDAKIELDTIDDAESRIISVNEEIDIEKGNIQELKEQLKEDVNDIKKDKSLSKEERQLAVESLKEEIQDEIESIKDQIGIYNEDKRGYVSDIKKAKKRLNKLEKTDEEVEPEAITVKDGDLKMTYKISEGNKSWSKATAIGKNFLLKIKEGMLFNGTSKVENSADIAYLFRRLRYAKSENAFAVVYTEEGDYLTAWLGTGDGNVKLNMSDIVKFVENAKFKLNTSNVKLSLVHNHPSGKLMPSVYDKDTYNKLYKIYDTQSNKNALPGVDVMPFVIINLDSGKFAVFNSDNSGEQLELTSVEEQKEFNVYELDKDVLYSKYAGARKMYSGKEVAELFSQIKAGDPSSHLGYAILDSENYMMFSSIVDSEHQMIGSTGYKALVDDIVSNMLGYNGNQIVFFDTAIPGQGTALVNDKHKMIRKLTEDRMKQINSNSAVPLSFNEDVPLITTQDKTIEERIAEGYKPVTKEDVFGTRREAALNSARKFMDKVFWNKIQAKVIGSKEVKSSLMAEDSKRVNQMANEMSKLLKPGFVSRLLGKKGVDKSFIDLANQYFTGSKEQKADAISKMKASTNPKAKKFLDLVIDMRSYVDARSSRIVNDPMYESLPEKSRKIIEDNIGTYVHRSYYFFDHPYFKISKDAKTKAIAEEHKILRIQEFNSIMSGVMGITEDQAIDLLKGRDAYLKRKARQSVLKQISDWENKRKTYRRDKNKSTSDAGLKVDESAMIQRKDVPAHIREMLGEIKDPVGRFVSTANTLNAIHRGSEMANKLLEILSSTSMYQVYSQEMYGKPWNKLTDTEKSLVTKRADENSLIKNKYNIKEREKSSYKKINNPLSPLHNMYVHNDIVEVLEEVPLYTTQFDGLSGMLHQTYLNVLKAQRQTKVLGNIPTWGKNFIGGIFFAGINGVINPTYFLRTSLNLAKKVAKGDKTYDSKIKEMAKYGLIGRDVNASTIGMSAMLFNYSMGEDVSTYNKYIANNRGKWKNFVRNLGSKYASIDDFTKMIIYDYEKKSFAIKMYGKGYSELTDQQQVEVKKEAAERVKQNTPTFSRMYRVAKKILQLPFGDFVGFKAESARSLGMTVKNMVEDYKTGIDKSNKLTKEQRAEYIKDASKKLVGLSTVLGAVPYIVLQSLMEGDDGEEEKEIRRLAKYIRPGWLNNHAILVKDIDRNLNVTVYDYTGLDPYGTVFSARELGEVFKPNMTVETAYNLMKGQDVYGRAIADPSDPAFQQWFDKAQYFIGSTYIPPNVSSSYRDAKKSKLEDPDVSVFSETFKIMKDRIVVRSYKYNMLQQFRYDVKEYELSFKENYLNTDWGETRKDRLDDIREKYVALYEVANSRGNYQAVQDAEEIIVRSFDDAEQFYILYNIDLSE